jgi:hypothetical protein
MDSLRNWEILYPDTDISARARVAPYREMTRPYREMTREYALGAPRAVGPRSGDREDGHELPWRESRLGHRRDEQLHRLVDALRGDRHAGRP